MDHEEHSDGWQAPEIDQGLHEQHTDGDSVDTAWSDWGHNEYYAQTDQLDDQSFASGQQDHAGEYPNHHFLRWRV